MTVYATSPARDLEAILVLLPFLMPHILVATRVLLSPSQKQLWCLPQFFSLWLQLHLRSPLLFLGTFQYLPYWSPYNPCSKLLLERLPLFKVVPRTFPIDCGGESSPASVHGSWQSGPCFPLQPFACLDPAWPSHHSLHSFHLQPCMPMPLPLNRPVPLLGLLFQLPFDHQVIPSWFLKWLLLYDLFPDSEDSTNSFLLFHPCIYFFQLYRDIIDT